MKTFLRILATVAGILSILFGLMGALFGEGTTLDWAIVAFFVGVGALLMFLGMKRSPEEKAERAARKEEERLRIEAGRARRAAYAHEQAAKTMAARTEAAEKIRVAEEERKKRIAAAEADRAAAEEERIAAEADLKRKQEEARLAEDAAWREHVQAEIRAEKAAQAQPVRKSSPLDDLPVWESKKAKQKRQTEERKQQAAAEGVACCPRCGSTSLSLNKKGFGGGKATAGMIGFGLGGAVAGTYGMNKMKITCMNCGYTYKPGKKTRI